MGLCAHLLRVQKPGFSQTPQCLRGGHQQPIVGAHKNVATIRDDGQRPAVSAHTRVYDREMDCGRIQGGHAGQDRRSGGDLAYADLVRDVRDPRLRPDPGYHGLARGHISAVPAEIAHEGEHVGSLHPALHPRDASPPL